MDTKNKQVVIKQTNKQKEEQYFKMSDIIGIILGVFKNLFFRGVVVFWFFCLLFFGGCYYIIF